MTIIRIDPMTRTNHERQVIAGVLRYANAHVTVPKTNERKVRYKGTLNRDKAPAIETTHPMAQNAIRRGDGALSIVSGDEFTVSIGAIPCCLTIRASNPAAVGLSLVSSGQGGVRCRAVVWLQRKVWRPKLHKICPLPGAPNGARGNAERTGVNNTLQAPVSCGCDSDHGTRNQRGRGHSLQLLECCVLHHCRIGAAHSGEELPDISGVTINLPSDCGDQDAPFALLVNTAKNNHRHQQRSYGANDLPLIHKCVNTLNIAAQARRTNDVPLSTKTRSRRCLQSADWAKA